MEDANNPPAREVKSGGASDENSDAEESDKDEDLAENCDVVEEDESTTPSLVSEPEPRPQRNVRQPERYNPSSGKSYHARLECVHNIITQGKPDLKYEEHETKIVALTIHHLKEVYVQQFGLN